MKLLSWGANSHGQLGQNIVSEACCVPAEISIPSLDPATIKSIVGGGGHTLILDKIGRVYSCGWNNKGQLGLEEDAATTFQPIKALHSQHVVQLACGWDSSLAVTLDGSLFVWGSNSYSQLGLPKQMFSWLKLPKKLPVSRIKQASLGLRHLAIVTEDDKVFVAGSGSKGQLGVVDSNRCPVAELQTLTQVPGLDNISSISCGQHHCIALSKEGKVFVWGDNRFGQLGLNSTAHPAVFTPQELSLSTLELKGFPTSVLAGWTHSVLMTGSGELVNWGRNTYGQLGRETSVSWSPSILKTFKIIKHVVVGSEHSVLLTEIGQLLSWGWNEHGNCGTGTQENVWHPSLVHVKGKATMIGTGACHSFVILDNN